MKIIFNIFIFLIIHHRVNAGLVKKGPAFATPIYADSYLPGAMQVIFHAVEQLKISQLEEAEQLLSTTLPPPPPTSSPAATTPHHKPGQFQPELTIILIENVTFTDKPNSDIVTKQPTPMDDKEKPELAGGEITSEVINGTQEIHEIQGVQSQGELNNNKSVINSNTSLVVNNNKTIDSIVKEIYEIIKPLNTNGNSLSAEESKPKDEEKEDENDDNRFTLLGEKVNQVPRPSLSTYLGRLKVPLNCPLQQLALLYDSLSKDARKQGFAKYSGYTDDVLKTLKSSSDGGIASQLMILLEKILERKEITREDTKTKITDTLKDLKDPGSQLNHKLRPLLPLKFNP